MTLPIVAQDPRYGGGFRSFAAAFWNAAASLGEDPRLVYLSRARGLSPRMGGPRVAVREEEQPPFRGRAVPSFVPELDALNQLVAGERIAREVRSAPRAWVVAASAPYGFGALRSGRPYGCWLATGLADEWEARRDELPPTRRLALAVNRPGLLRMERAVLRGAAYVATISERSRAAIAAAAALAPERVAVWPVPVDTAAFAPAADVAWEAALDEPAIVFVGRGADPRKNLRLLAEAFPLIRGEVPEARLRLVGEPPPGSVLAAAGPGVDVLGEVASVADAIRDAALLVLPSRQEGFGIVVAEALACGIPAIVTPSGGPEDLVRASGGGVVLDGWHPRELAAAVVALLRDRERLRAMRTAGRAYVEREHSAARLSACVSAGLAALGEARRA